MHAFIVCTGQQASAISAVSNTQLETDDMHIDTVATSTGRENEGTLNGATGNEQIEMVEEMDVGKSHQCIKCSNGIVPMLYRIAGNIGGH